MGEHTPVIPETVSVDGRWHMNKALRLVVESTRPGEKALIFREPEKLLFRQHIEDVAHLFASKNRLKKLGAQGHMPHCVTDRDGRLHVVFASGDMIHYMLIGENGDPLKRVKIPNSVGGLRPWVYVASSDEVHVVWDNWQNVYYTAFTGGMWQNPIPLPKGFYERNSCGQIGGRDNSIYITSWAITKDQGGSSMVYRVKGKEISLITSYGSSLYGPPSISISKNGQSPDTDNASCACFRRIHQCAAN